MREGGVRERGVREGGVREGGDGGMSGWFWLMLVPQRLLAPERECVCERERERV